MNKDIEAAFDKAMERSMESLNLDSALYKNHVYKCAKVFDTPPPAVKRECISQKGRRYIRYE